MIDYSLVDKLCEWCRRRVGGCCVLICNDIGQYFNVWSRLSVSTGHGEREDVAVDAIQICAERIKIKSDQCLCYLVILK